MKKLKDTFVHNSVAWYEDGLNTEISDTAHTVLLRNIGVLRELFNHCSLEDIAAMKLIIKKAGSGGKGTKN